MVRHKAGTRAEQRQVAAALVHQAQLVLFYRLAQLVIADFQVTDLGHHGGVFDTRNLLVAPYLQRLGGGGVVTVTVDDEGFFQAHVQF